jgi:hypothetical protein
MVIVQQIVQNHHRPHQVLVEREIKLMMNSSTMMEPSLVLEERIVKEVELEPEFQGMSPKRGVKRVQPTQEVVVVNHEVQVRNLHPA